MFLRWYSLVLALFEFPGIWALLTGVPASQCSIWFSPSVDSVKELHVMYAAVLTFLVICRVGVFISPKNKGILANAVAVHALEIPLFGFFFLPAFPNTTPIQTAIFGFILVNPIIFFYAFLSLKSARK